MAEFWLIRNRLTSSRLSDIFASITSGFGAKAGFDVNRVLVPGNSTTLSVSYLTSPMLLACSIGFSMNSSFPPSKSLFGALIS